MTIRVAPLANGFGAEVTAIDLRTPLQADEVRTIRAAWLQHQVIFFPDQPLSHEQLERFSRYFGPFGKDPYVVPLKNHRHILEVRREPVEAIAPFGSSWHSDWSFQPKPPSATLLHSKVVPPVGGDTHFCSCTQAYAALPAATRTRLEGLQAIHSARRPYSRVGYQRGGGPQRSVKVRPSDSAWATQYHPLVRTHPETGEQALWVNPVYTIGIRGLSDRESAALLEEIFAHMLNPDFIYEHQWTADMLTMWDNRSVLHCAQGGYDGHLRVMHRTTVAGCAPF